MRKELHDRLQTHIDFWNGGKGSLILIPAGNVELYNTSGYKDRFYNPQIMFDYELSRTRGVLDWPTDGLPAIRPNLGTVFVPAIAGQDFIISDENMPWPGEPLTRDALAGLKDIDIDRSDIMKLACDFFRLCSSNKPDASAYLPDTQGIFDIAHLLYGDNIFYDIADAEHKQWITDYLEDVCGLYIKVSEKLKRALGEPANTMMHGHGREQGLYFPNAGVRISEDTATLLSPAMIDEFVMPHIHKASKHFGGSFIHFCGRHQYLYEAMVKDECVRAIDLGNPEMYDSRWLLEKCAGSNTVFYGKLSALDNEDWKTYINRLAALVKDTGARCVLRPDIFPSGRDECNRMYEMWHKLTE